MLLTLRLNRIRTSYDLLRSFYLDDTAKRRGNFLAVCGQMKPVISWGDPGRYEDVGCERRSIQPLERRYFNPGFIDVDVKRGDKVACKIAP